MRDGVDAALAVQGLPAFARLFRGPIGDPGNSCERIWHGHSLLT